MEEKFDTMLSEDYDDDGELNVEHYPIPKGLQRAWDALSSNDELEKGLNATVATALTHTGDKSPGPGLGVNYYIKTPLKKPKRKQMKDEDDPTGVKRGLRAPKTGVAKLKADKEDYVGYRGVDPQRAYELQELTGMEVSTEEVEANREDVQKQFEARKTSGNKVDVRGGWNRK